MKKVFVISVQGTSITTMNESECNHTNPFSHTEVIDLCSKKDLGWKKGLFTQSNHQLHTEEEIQHLRDLGLYCYYINPWDSENNNKDCVEFIEKLENFKPWMEENGEQMKEVFDGWFIIGEIDLDLVNNGIGNYKGIAY